MTGKVSQICCREDLDRARAKVIVWVLESFENRHVGLSVIVENVPKNVGQLVDLSRCRRNADIGGDGIRVIHS